MGVSRLVYWREVPAWAKTEACERSVCALVDAPDWPRFCRLLTISKGVLYVNGQPAWDQYRERVP